MTYRIANVLKDHNVVQGECVIIYMPTMHALGSGFHACLCKDWSCSQVYPLTMIDYVVYCCVHVIRVLMLLWYRIKFANLILLCTV